MPVAEHVDYISGNVQAQFAVSPKGILAFSSNPAADAVLTWYDRSGKALGEVGRPGNIFRFAISPDGGMVAVEHANPDSGNANIWLHDLKRGAESRFTFDQLSDTSFPGREGKWQITDQKGNFPVWRRDGKELYFIGRGGQLMAVDVKAGERFEHSAPKPLFKANKTANSLFDVGPDGRFLMATPPERDQSTPITVVLNWHSGLPGK